MYRSAFHLVHGVRELLLGVATLPNRTIEHNRQPEGHIHVEQIQQIT